MILSSLLAVALDCCHIIKAGNNPSPIIPLKTLVRNWPVTKFRFRPLLPTGVGYCLRPSILAHDGHLALAVEEPST